MLDLIASLPGPARILLQLFRAAITAGNNPQELRAGSVGGIGGLAGPGEDTPGLGKCETRQGRRQERLADEHFEKETVGLHTLSHVMRTCSGCDADCFPGNGIRSSGAGNEARTAPGLTSFDRGGKRALIGTRKELDSPMMDGGRTMAGIANNTREWHEMEEGQLNRDHPRRTLQNDCSTTAGLLRRARAPVWMDVIQVKRRQLALVLKSLALLTLTQID
ncbi:hypothetical protein Bbelb_390470 [Branchiostoma belcheri]|nr:hypothetical protein Bbelb_390470 [Branchiostoma belcheri]